MWAMFEYDLHTHTTFSDGALIPAESVRRYEAAGYKGIAFTDHADHTNFSFILENQLKLKSVINNQDYGFKVLVGLEFTHVHPDLIMNLKDKAVSEGADLIVVHGETIVEPVKEGTNRAAIEAGVDILAHPGIITEEDTALAAENNVYLEITTRKGHSLTNGHVAGMSARFGANMILSNDFHSPGDAVSFEYAGKIIAGAGIHHSEIENILANNKRIFESKLEV